MKNCTNEKQYTNTRNGVVVNFLFLKMIATLKRIYRKISKKRFYFFEEKYCEVQMPKSSHAEKS